MSNATPSAGGTRSQRGRAIKNQSGSGGIWPWVAGAAVVVLLLGGAFLLFSRPSDDGEIAGLQTFANQERGHSETPQAYPQTPPVGGVHTPDWQNCGVYDRPIKKERGVHALEHGAVWITYKPDLPAEQVAELRKIVQARPFTLLSPYPGLTSPVVASAWGLQVALDSATDPRLTTFVARYVQGPQTPEPGAACSGGSSATE